MRAESHKQSDGFVGIRSLGTAYTAWICEIGPSLLLRALSS